MSQEKRIIDLAENKLSFRQFFMVLVLLFIIAAEVLLDYIKADFDPSVFADTTYWILLGLSCLSVILITITVRDVFRERELTRNADVKAIQTGLKDTHSDLKNRNLVANLEGYMDKITYERKLYAYRCFLENKRANAKPKATDKWAKLLETAEADIKRLPVVRNSIRFSWWQRIKFNSVNMTIVFGKTNRTTANADENLSGEEASDIVQMLVKKLLPLITLSVALYSLTFSPGEFAVEILVTTFFRLFRFAMSAYTGATTGQDYIKVKLYTKLQRRIEFVQKFLEKEKANKQAKELAAE